jgi:hypothetical protein
MPDDPSAARRRDLPARVFRLGEEPRDDLSNVTTPEQRIEMVAELTRRYWELSGRAWPAYTRAEMPVRVIRRA